MNRYAGHIAIFLPMVFLLPGCFVYTPTADFISQRYTNTVAYFNTFYNAQRAFSDAETELEKARKDFQEKGTPGKKFDIPSTVRTKLNASIEKNSKILALYSTSKWVDDALLMIGKAYSYLGDDMKAERKYLELFAKYPESGLIPEAQLWYGRGLLNQKKSDEGIKQLGDLYERTSSSDDDIAGQAALAMAEYYFGIGSDDQALKYYRLAADHVSGGDDLAAMERQIGLCEEHMNRLPEAERSYERAADEADSYAAVFRATVHRIKVIAKQQRYEEALAMLSDMLEDSKNAEFASRLHFEIAQILYDEGKLNEAIQKYTYVDTAFARTDESARSYFALGKIYETITIDYDSARVNYNKAKSEYAGSSVTLEATAKAAVFNTYQQLWNDYRKYDSLSLAAIREMTRLDSAEWKPAPRDSSFLHRTATTDSARAAYARADSVAAAADTASKRAFAAKREAQRAMVDSMQRSLVRTQFELGSLFFIELQQPDSALHWFDHIVVINPESEFAPRSLYSIAEINRAYRHAAKEDLDKLYRKIVDEYPLSPYAQEARKYLGLPPMAEKSDTADVLFRTAESLADSEKYERAIQVLNSIAERSADSPLCPKALYTAGWYYENSLINSDSAVAVYRRLIKSYPLSAYAAAARPKVTEYDNELKRLEEQKKQELEKAKEEQRTSEAPPKVEGGTPPSAPISQPKDSLSTRPQP